MNENAISSCKRVAGIVSASPTSTTVKYYLVQYLQGKCYSILFLPMDTKHFKNLSKNTVLSQYKCRLSCRGFISDKEMHIKTQ